MQIVIRADASYQIGSGHVMRCVALAEVLKQHGHQVRFVCLSLAGNFIEYLIGKGFAVTTLPYFESSLHDDSLYAKWLTRSEQQDAQAFLEKVEHTDAVIVDHYGIGEIWESAVRNALTCPIIAIDDLVRSHQADLVIDQTLGRSNAEYAGCTNVIAGQTFAILKSSFCQKREYALTRTQTTAPIKLLVSFGAIDQDNITLEALTHLQHLDAQITVLLSQRAPHYEAVAAFCQQHNHITHIDFCDQMADLMLTHDMAIGAPGTTSWERACLGLPSIVVAIADNQITMCTKLVEYGVAMSVSKDTLYLLPSYVETLQQQWQTFRGKNLKICDGLGTFRVASALETLSQPNAVSLMLATMDQATLLYQWQRHPNTRRFAINTAVPSWPEHESWLQKKLTSLTDYVYLIMQAQQPLGVVRLDRKAPFEYLISIYIAPEHYGKGLAITALREIDRIHPHVCIKATVLPDNHASQALFSKAGYSRVSQDSFERPRLLGELQ